MSAWDSKLEADQNPELIFNISSSTKNYTTYVAQFIESKSIINVSLLAIAGCKETRL
ncbi:MAG: hypothetical protein Alis3KO_41120 [Aliiglaciecola sp.]